MAIVVNLDVMLAKRKMAAGDLAERIGITPANLSILKNQKAKAIRFSTLNEICRVLDCQPGDILEYQEDEPCKDVSFCHSSPILSAGSIGRPCWAPGLC